jgi:TFIIF-interacting CTD phosphatase-like protein
MKELPNAHFILGSEILTVLRPGLPEFLRDVSVCYEICVYTLGMKEYANAIVDIVDPDRTMISRIISREDSTREDQKDMDVVYATDNITLIMDDMPKMWPMYPRNLVPMIPFHYSSNTSSIYLKEISSFLNMVHTSYFSKYISPSRNVADHMDVVWGGV